MDQSETIQQFEQYLNRRFSGRRTPKDYVSDIRQFTMHCQKAWREVSLHDIDEFVDWQHGSGLKPATVKRRVAALKTFFDFLAEESGEVNWPNPVRFKRHAGKQPRQLPRDVSNERVEQLWKVIVAPRDRAWFVLMLRAGLRVGEVVRLKIEDVLGAAGANQAVSLRVWGKGQKERVAWLSSDAYAVLQEWLAVRPPSDEPYIFLNGRGRPLTVNGIQWLLRSYGQQVGIHLTPHQLRHTFARQVTEAGMPVTSLGKLLGHAQITTTQIYTASADPTLCQAYQQAMAQLERTALARHELPGDQALQPYGVETFNPNQPLTSVIASVPVPALPDWEQWAPHLPTGIRQACLEYVKSQVHNWKPQRRRRRAQDLLGKLRGFWDWQMSQRPISSPGELTLADLQAFQTAQITAGKKASASNFPLSLVLNILRLQAEAGRPVNASVFRLRPLPRPDALPRHLSFEESYRLENYVRARLNTSQPICQLENACFFVLAHTGMRSCECVELTFQDLDLHAGRIIIRQGKGRRDRLVYLSSTAHTALSLYLVHCTHPLTNALFAYPNGHPVNYRWLHRCITALGKAAGVPNVTPHRLRHTLATNLLNAGMKIVDIQKILGHEVITTTMIYARVLDQTVEKDYHQAMRWIEGQQFPFSSAPLLVENWPLPVPEDRPISAINSRTTLDNSV